MNIGRTTFLIGMYCMISTPLFPQNTYLELNLNNQALQTRIRTVRSQSPLELFRVIDRAANDKRIHGIILNASGYSASQEYMWELRQALQEFKSHNKKICAFIGSADIDMYCLASVADKIVMDDTGVLSLAGYAWGRGYVQHTLDKLGVGARELRYLKYKSASETFTRDSISDADREQYGKWLDDIYTVTKDAITGARGWDSDTFESILNTGFLYSARDALEQKLVDRLGREDAVKETVKDLEGKEVNSFVCYGDTDYSITGTKSYYGPGRAGGLFSRPPVIAVVYANGQTDMEQGMAARSLSRIIRKIPDNKRIKALVLRINSPGGSAEAADYIAEAVKYVKQKIPVVVSMGPVAASGGYWAALYANEIYATPYTLTGSIGVIGSWFYDKGMNNKLGFSVDVLQKGSHADLATGFLIPRRDLNDGEIERYRQMIMSLYGDFVAKVADGRSMDPAKVESLAQGRVYSGLGALDAGLIDKIGGLFDAVNSARSLAGIPADKKVICIEYPKPRFIDKVLERLPLSSVFASRTPAADASMLMDFVIPEQLCSDLLYRMANNGRVMPLLPFDGSQLLKSNSED